MRSSFLITLTAVSLIAGACAHPADPLPSAASRLETTPRHGEWIAIESGGRPLHAWVVYPETSAKAGAVLVIHENRGLTDWVRSVADTLAKNGYIAIAPDMLSGAAPGGGRTRDFASEDAAREAISRLPAPQVAADLAAAAAYVRGLPAANGRLAVAGFCWGGARAWEAANSIPGLAATYVFYGTGPSEESGVARIGAPVFGFYGEMDERVNATLPATIGLMEAQGKRFEPLIYEGAGHAYMRIGEDASASAANRDAMRQSWTRWLALLADTLR
jgi:carboxymethylenebutenolidase